MRIGINSYRLSDLAGTGRYIHTLLDGLRELDGRHEYVRFEARGRPYTVWEQAVLPVAIRKARLDVFFGPAFGLPLASPVPGVVMVHDLSFVHHPEAYRRKQRGYYRLIAGPSARKARRVIVPSAAVAADVHERWGVPEERIDVIAEAVAPEIRREEDAERLAAVRRRYRLPEQFVLYLGAVEPRKNVAGLIEAYALARREHGLGVPLVVAGPSGWQAERILARADEHVLRPPRIAGEDLGAVYTLAELFVFPSLYEGWGHPPLEAMACGTPVVAGTRPALPEVLGDAALFVDPEDVPALAAAIARGLGDQALRERLRQAGTRRVAELTPRRMAEETLASLERAAA